MLEAAEMDSLGASLGEDSMSMPFPGDEPTPGPSKRKRGRPRKNPLTAEFIEGSDDDEPSAIPGPTGLSRSPRKSKKSAEEQIQRMAEGEESTLADDLEYSSEDDGDADWEAVGGDDDEEEEGLTVTIENLEEQAAAVVVDDGQIVDMGEYVEDSDASVLLFGGNQQQHSDQQQAAAEAEAEQVQVDESYDPTDFFSSIGKGQVVRISVLVVCLTIILNFAFLFSQIQTAPTSGVEVAATIEMPDIVTQAVGEAGTEHNEAEPEAGAAIVHEEMVATEVSPSDHTEGDVSEPTVAVSLEDPAAPVAASAPIDVVNEDLDISDDSDDDAAQGEAKKSDDPQTAKDPPQDEDEDGLFF
jgi:hypothetical protein